MSGRLALAALAVVAAAAAEESKREVFDIGGGHWGRVRRVLPPEFPKAAIESRLSGYVDVTGIASPSETLVEASLVPSSPEAAVFIEPLKQVLEHWRFQPRLDHDCQPTSVRETTRVWFEWKEEKPVISISTVVQTQDQIARRRSLRPERAFRPEYPRAARREGEPAFVYAAIDVDADGRVERVNAREHTRAHYGRRFEEATRLALLRWRFPPAEDPAGAPRRGCVSIDFKIVD